MVFVDSALQSKEEIIDFISKEAKENHLISDESQFKEKVFAREAEISTSIGSQVAIPHGKSAAVATPFIAFLRTEDNIIWDKTMNEPVKLIFLIGVPDKEANKLHLRYIAEISKKLINDDFREKLLTLRTKEEIVNLLDGINKNIR